jgi:hypothetical protein
MRTRHTPRPTPNSIYTLVSLQRQAIYHYTGLVRLRGSSLSYKNKDERVRDNARRNLRFVSAVGSTADALSMAIGMRILRAHVHVRIRTPAQKRKASGSTAHGVTGTPWDAVDLESQTMGPSCSSLAKSKARGCIASNANTLWPSVGLTHVGCAVLSPTT